MDTKYYYYTETGQLYGITKHTLNIPGVEFTLEPCIPYNDLENEEPYFIDGAWEIRTI